MEDSHNMPPRRYNAPFYQLVTEQQPGEGDSDHSDSRPLLNSERLRDLPPKDILARAFHGYYFSFPLYFSVSCFSYCVLFAEQPIQLDPRTPTFVLGLEQVAALVEATGKIVGNKIAAKFTTEKLYPSTYALFLVSSC